MTDAQEHSPTPDLPDLHITGRALLTMPAQQVHALYKLRVDVFVNEQGTPYAEIDDTDAHPNTHHLLAYIHPGSGPNYPHGVPDPGSPLRLVGTARVFGSPEHQHIGRLCVHPDVRGYGFAHRILDEALAVCRERAAMLDPTTQPASVQIEAQSHMVEYYATLGFQPIEEPFDIEGVPHQLMIMPLDAGIAPAADAD